MAFPLCCLTDWYQRYCAFDVYAALFTARPRTQRHSTRPVEFKGQSSASNYREDNQQPREGNSKKTSSIMHFRVEGGGGSIYTLLIDELLRLIDGRSLY